MINPSLRLEEIVNGEVASSLIDAIVLIVYKERGVDEEQDWIKTSVVGVR